MSSQEGGIDENPSSSSELVDDSSNMGQLKSKLDKIGKLHGKKPKSLSEDDVMDIAENKHSYMCGVVEGFYGRPWTAEQRLELFKRMKTMGLNTYLYAPKDDYKHRLFWREKYSQDEADLLKKLICEAKEYDVTFVYAISPGLDMIFTSEKEISALQNKLLQVKEMGCEAFALLFDDIDPVLCASDLEKYASSAAAQASITNLMFEALSQPRFIFCPTEYCNNMATPDVKNSEYLKTLGQDLDPQISVMWTGPKVVSNTISVDSIQELTKVLRRKVVIWDNIHANDYDPKRVFLGPFKGRSTDLIPLIAGVMTNPNCEFEGNFVAMHTLATWWHGYERSRGKRLTDCEENVASATGGDATTGERAMMGGGSPVALDNDDSCDSGSGAASSRTSDDDSDSDYSSHGGGGGTGQMPPVAHFDHGTYDPTRALEQALRDWLPLFQKPRHSTAKIIPRSGATPIFPPVPPIITRGPISPGIAITQALSQPISSSCVVGRPPSPPGPVLPDQQVDDPNGKVELNNTSNVAAVAARIKQAGDADAMGKDAEGKTLQNPVITVADPDDVIKPDDGVTRVMSAGSKQESDMETCEDSEVSAGLEEMQTDFGAATTKTTPSSLQMDTADGDDAAMQTDDADSDISMSTTNGASAPQSEMEAELVTSLAADIIKDKDATGGGETSLDRTLEALKPPKASQPPQVDRSRRKADDAVSYDDLNILAQCFFLPYEHGHIGHVMVHKFKWLKDHALKLSKQKNKKSEAYLDKALRWSERALSFEENCRTVQEAFNRICACSNRALLYDIYPYISDMKGVITMLRSYIKWLGRIEVKPDSGNVNEDLGEKGPELKNDAISGFGWLGPDPEPWVFRGGLSGEFQRLLPVHSSFDLFCHVVPLEPQVNTYIIRPYVPADEESVFKVCYSTSDNGTSPSDLFVNHQQLPADRLVGALLTLSPNYCFVVEDDGGVCGYLAATLNARKFWKQYEIAYLPEMRAKYDAAARKHVAKEGDLDEMSEVERMIDDFHSEIDRFDYGSDKLMSTHPSMMSLGLHPRSHPNIAKGMMVCLLNALKSHSSFGVHVLVRQDWNYHLELYAKLGFVKLLADDDADSKAQAAATTRGVQVLGRSF